jgi:predicted nucleic acid-binding protein
MYMTAHSVLLGDKADLMVSKKRGHNRRRSDAYNAAKGILKNTLGSVVACSVINKTDHKIASTALVNAAKYLQNPHRYARIRTLRGDSFAEFLEEWQTRNQVVSQ